MIVAIPIAGLGATDTRVGQSWGRAAAVAVADVRDGGLARWSESAVGWDASHDAGTGGSHHARVMRFLREQEVEVVAAPHVGPGMVRMLDSAGIRLVTGVAGDARSAVVAVVDLLGADGQA